MDSWTFQRKLVVGGGEYKNVSRRKAEQHTSMRMSTGAYHFGRQLRLTKKIILQEMILHLPSLESRLNLVTCFQQIRSVVGNDSVSLLKPGRKRHCSFLLDYSPGGIQLPHDKDTQVTSQRDPQHGEMMSPVKVYC